MEQDGGQELMLQQHRDGDFLFKVGHEHTLCGISKQIVDISPYSSIFNMFNISFIFIVIYTYIVMINHMNIYI